MEGGVLEEAITLESEEQVKVSALVLPVMCWSSTYTVG